MCTSNAPPDKLNDTSVEHFGLDEKVENFSWQFFYI